jgi:hypothetical protein
MRPSVYRAFITNGLRIDCIWNRDFHLLTPTPSRRWDIPFPQQALPGSAKAFGLTKQQKRLWESPTHAPKALPWAGRIDERGVLGRQKGLSRNFVVDAKILEDGEPLPTIIRDGPHFFVWPGLFVVFPYFDDLRR